MRLTRQMSARIRANIHTYETLSQTVAKYSSQATYAQCCALCGHAPPQRSISGTSTKCRIFSLRPPREVTAPQAGTFLCFEPQDTPIPHPYKVRYLPISASRNPTSRARHHKVPTPYRPDSECHAPASSINGNPCAARPISRLSHAPTSLLRTAPCTTAQSLNAAMHRPPTKDSPLHDPPDLSFQPHTGQLSINGSPLHSMINLGPGDYEQPHISDSLSDYLPRIYRSDPLAEASLFREKPPLRDRIFMGTRDCLATALPP